MSIECFSETDAGDLFVVNGIDEPLRWDGFANAFAPIGMAAPTDAPVIGGIYTGSSAISGTYWAYVRFIDVYGNPSNLSPISNEFTAETTSGTITGVTSATPIVVTDAAHGLITGETVKITGVGGVTEANAS